jgi:FkbM family methyltransferase
LQAELAPLHHSSIRAQAPVTVIQTPEIDVDFIGTKTRRSFIAGMLGGAPTMGSTQMVTPSYPPFDEEYFEWVDVLETVETAADRYVMIELGAGYGRWSMRAAAALRRKPGCRFVCVAVEAEPVHFRWMLDHFRDNGVDPRDHELVWAAVGAQPGFVPFWVGEADAWYGQAMASNSGAPIPDLKVRRRLKARSALGRPPVDAPTDKSVVWVPCVTLSDLLWPYPHVDLIDIDVQGAEVDVLTSAIELLNERVRRIHIGTHSTEIEERLRTLFSTHGWRSLNDYPCLRQAPTPYGEIAFGDGVQTWQNSRLDDTATRADPRPETKRAADQSVSSDQRAVALLRARVDELETRVGIFKHEKHELEARYQAARDKLQRVKVAPRWSQRLLSMLTGGWRRKE